MKNIGMILWSKIQMVQTRIGNVSLHPGFNRFPIIADEVDKMNLPYGDGLVKEYLLNMCHEKQEKLLDCYYLSDIAKSNYLHRRVKGLIMDIKGDFEAGRISM